MVVRKILGTVICAFFISTAFAQKFGAGAYLGMSTNQIDGDGLRGFDLPGLNVGVFVDYPLGEYSALQMEIAFIQKGAKELPSDTSNFYKVVINYIEIPLLYTFSFKKLSFEIGPGFDFLVSSSEEWNNIENNSQEFDRLNITGIFGINYHFNQKWYVNFRSNYSINPIREGTARAGRPNAISFGGPGQRNLTLSFAINYRFQ